MKSIRYLTGKDRCHKYWLQDPMFYQIRNPNPSALIEGIDWTMRVNRNDITNTRMVNAIKTRELLKNFSIRICRKDRLYSYASSRHSHMVIDEISRSNNCCGNLLVLLNDNFKIYYKRFIAIMVSTLKWLI